MAVLIGRYKSTTTAALTVADTSIDVASVEGLPAIGVADHVYLTLIDPQNDLIEVVKVTGVTGSTLAPVVRGQSDTTARQWPAGTIIVLKDDPLTLTEFVSERATQADPSDQAAIQNEVRQQVGSRVKQYAQTGSTAKIPISDVGGANQLDAEDHDSVDQGRTIPLIDGNGNIVERISVHEYREFVKDSIRQLPEYPISDQATKFLRGDGTWQVPMQGQGQGTGVTPEQASDIESAKDFEAALRQDVSLVASAS